MIRIFNPTGFSTCSLEILLDCQEYPEGDVAQIIELELIMRQIARPR